MLFISHFVLPMKVILKRPTGAFIHNHEKGRTSDNKSVIFFFSESGEKRIANVGVHARLCHIRQAKKSASRHFVSPFCCLVCYVGLTVVKPVASDARCQPVQLYVLEPLQ